MRGWERDVLPHAGVGEEGKDAGGGILRMGFEEVALGEVGEEEDWGAAEREGDGAGGGCWVFEREIGGEKGTLGPMSIGEYVKELGDRGGGERWKCDVESCVNAEPTGFGKEIV